MRNKRIIAATLILLLLTALLITGCSENKPEMFFEELTHTILQREPGRVEDNTPEEQKKPSPEPETTPETTPNTRTPEAVSDAQTPETEPTVQAPEITTTKQEQETEPTTQTQGTESTSQTPEAEPATPAPPNISVPPVVPVEAITLDVTEITISRYGEYKLNHTVFPADAADKTVTFKSSKETVATVTNDGSVYATGAGTAIIQCISASGEISASCTVTVIVPVTGISVSTSRSMYKTDEICSYTVSVFPEDATDKTFIISISNANAEDTGNSAVTFKSSGRVSITATASSGVSGSREINVIDLAEYASEVFRLTNIERQNNGLPDFSRNSALTATAETRAKECVVFFSHSRPDGRDCFTAFAENSVSYRLAAENIGYGQTTPAEVVAGWMNSPGHRANILNPDLGYLGAGVEMDSNGRLYWSQEFTD